MAGKRIFRFWALICVILVILAVGGGCSVFDWKEGLASPVEELDERLVKANNDLGFKLYRELRAGSPEENIMISPSSILAALAMAYNGAEGETRAAMEKVLLLEGMNREDANSAFADLLTILQNPDPKVEIDTANSLWARHGVSFYEDFLQRISDNFKAETAELDFDDPGAADVINSWVKEQTRDKIDGIVEPPIDPGPDPGAAF